MKTVDYKILEEHDHTWLTSMVCEHVKNGWETLGGVAVVQPYGCDYPKFFQSMILKRRAKGFLERGK